MSGQSFEAKPIHGNRLNLSGDTYRSSTGTTLNPYLYRMCVYARAWATSDCCDPCKDHEFRQVYNLANTGETTLWAGYYGTYYTAEHYGANSNNTGGELYYTSDNSTHSHGGWFAGTGAPC